MTMGERIHQKRKELGYTMEELGNKVGVNKSAVNKWEKGIVSNMKRSTIEKLASVLEVSPVWLMGMEEPPAQLGNKDGEFLLKLHQLTKENRIILENILDAILQHQEGK